MRISSECAVPLLATGLALSIATGCSFGSSSPATPREQAPTAANPGFVPRLQALGRTFLRVYHTAPSYDARTTPFKSEGKVTVAEVDIHVGSQVLKLTINQLPSPGINPSGITSLDILRFDPNSPRTGFDMTIGRNRDGTLDASCHSYQPPKGYSETGQERVFDAAGDPLTASSPALASAFASDMLTAAAEQLAAAGSYTQQPATGDPCGVTFGGG